MYSGRISRWCKRGSGNERWIMRCREGQTSSTQKCSIFVTVNWMDIIKEVFMVGNFFSIINVSFVISITSDTTTYPINKAVIHNKIVTFHWQTIFVIEDCEDLPTSDNPQ